MEFRCVFFLSMFLLSCSSAKSTKQEEKELQPAPRQLEYVSLISTLLQQSNVLTSVDGVLLALTTAFASAVTRIKPLLIATSMSYLMYVGGAMFFPQSMVELGLPVLEVPSPRHTGRSVGSDGSFFEGALAETFTKGLKLSPIMTIITNVSVTVVSDTMARLRMASRMLIHQMSRLQGNMVWFSRMLSNECLSRFMCRVGQFTQANFPTISTLLRTIADTYPGMDDFAVAIIRGTSSSNCTLLYPDCIP